MFKAIDTMTDYHKAKLINLAAHLTIANALANNLGDLDINGDCYASPSDGVYNSDGLDKVLLAITGNSIDADRLFSKLVDGHDYDPHTAVSIIEEFLAELDQSTVIEFRVTSAHVEGNEWVAEGTRWYAEPTHDCITNLNGHPVGRGYTEASAIEDLKRRVIIENDGDFTFNQVF